MYKDYRVLCIIPARGGSKGLPGKNIKRLSGKPLIAYTIEQAKKSKYIDRIIVSFFLHQGWWLSNEARQTHGELMDIILHSHASRYVAALPVQYPCDII